MKNLLQKWNSLSLIVRILIGLIIGAILGVAAPKATGLALLGDLFVGALRAVAPILVFVLVIASIFPGHQFPVLLWKKSRRCHQDRYHHVYVQHIPGCCDCCHIQLHVPGYTDIGRGFL